MKDILSTQRVYVCISIIGCQGVVTAKNSIAGVTASIDRNSLLCEPCVIDNIQSTTELHKSLGDEEFHVRAMIPYAEKEQMA